MSSDAVVDVYRLTPAQAGILYHTTLRPRPGLYIGALSVHLAGALDADRLAAVWRQLLARHEVLRTAFLWDGLDAPVQVVRADVALPWSVQDWSGLSPQAQEDAFKAHLEAERARGFDLASAPLFRLLLVRLGADRWRLVMTSHHIILDGWSLAVLLEEMATLYRAHGESAPAPLPPAVPFRRHVAEVLAIDAQESERYWRERLADLQAAAGPDLLAPAHDRPGEGARASVTAALDATATRALRDTARTLQVTLPSLLMAAWALILQRYGGREEVVFGVAQAGRGPGNARGVGLYLGVQPLRLSLPASARLRTWLAQVHAAVQSLAMRARDDLQLIQSASGRSATTALFDTLVAIERRPERDALSEDLRVTRLETADQSHYPLAFLPSLDDRVTLELVFDPARYHHGAMQRMVEQLAHLLQVLPAHVETCLDSVPVLPEAHVAALARLGQGAPAPPPPYACVSEAILGHGRSRPEQIALIDATGQVSYGALARQSHALAAALGARGIGPGQRVALHMERGCAFVIALLGVLRAGAAYVPLDPGYPRERLAVMLQDSGCALRLCQPAHRHALDGDVTCCSLDELVNNAPITPPLLPPPVADAEAYVLYTSGSSGRPKGVRVSRRNLAHSTHARRAVYAEAPERFLLLSPIAFDSSVVGLFWTLAEGSTLVIADADLPRDPAALTAHIRRHGITHMLCLPSLYAVILEQARPADLVSLRCVIVAGEAVPNGLSARHRQRARQARLYNEYGPSEATVWCTLAEITDLAADARAPIGRPIPYTSIHLRDAALRAVPHGVAGEICVAGAGVALGYVNRTDAEAAAFVPATPDGPGRLYRTGDIGRFDDDGVLHFHGRRDGQVKIDGQRIEPGEIEHAVRTHAGGQDVAVIALDAPARARLVGFIETPPDRIDIDGLLRRLRDVLPPAMLPSRLQTLERLPRLPNGKLDRVALTDLARDAEAAARPAVAPRSALERQVHALWQGVLGHDRFGVHDPFTEVGGHSLRSIQLVSRARQAGLALTPNALFEFPTIAELAEHLTRPADMAAAAPGAARAPLFMIHGGRRAHLALTRKLDGAQQVHLLHDHWDTGAIAADAGINDLADAYLRAIRAQQPAGPYWLCGYSMGAPIVHTIARWLEADGETLALVALIDPPDDPAVFGGIMRTHGSDAPAGPRAPGRVAREWAALRAQRPVQIPAHLRGRATSLWQRRIARPVRVAYAAWLNRRGREVPLGLRDAYVEAVYAAAYRRYTLEPYPGDLLLLRSREPRPGRDARLWPALATGQTTVIAFDCSHKAFRFDAAIVEAWTTALAAHIAGLDAGAARAEAAAALRAAQ